MMKATITGTKKTQKWLKNKQDQSEKAMNVAIKKETFRLMRLMKKEIRTGAPGGRRFDPLSSMARFYSSRRGYKKHPFGRMHYGVRYQFSGDATGFNNFKATLGFLGGNNVQNLFRSLARKHQTGFQKLITPKQRQWVINRGAELGTVEGGDTPFFLKKSTTHFKTPARPIISPFWQAHHRAAQRNIQTMFRRKMAGERI
jgi:hypothetical protein